MTLPPHHAFRLTGQFVRCAPLGNGHINTTYHLLTDRDQYLFQRVNHHVFPQVGRLMDNIKRVTEHVRAHSAAARDIPVHQETLTLIATHEGAFYHRDKAGNYWRAFRFLDGLRSYDLVETPAQAFAGARSYGYFLRFLDDFPPTSIFPVLPDFHNVLKRLEAFRRARTQVQRKLKSRVQQCHRENQRVMALAEPLSALQQAWDQGLIRSRVTHNDTKFNNVLLTPEGHGKAVVDLDTVMPGIVHFDLGDGLRTAAATAVEDEADLQLVGIDPEKYAAFTEGYLSVTHDYLSEAERHFLPYSGALLAYLMAVRFLTDYYEGDVYYSIKYPEHNLVRGRNQLQLAELFYRQYVGR